MRLYAGPGGRNPNLTECPARAPLLPMRARLAAEGATSHGGDDG